MTTTTDNDAGRTRGRLLKLFFALLVLCASAAMHRSSTDVDAFPMKEPRWPFPGTNPYTIPVVGENVTTLRIYVTTAANGAQSKAWMRTFNSLGIVDIVQTSIFYEIGVDTKTDLGFISRSDRPESFIISEQFMTKEVQRTFENVTQYPYTYQPTVFSYNIPGFPLFIQDCATQCISLSIEVLADIYMGLITVWNDPAILALNPTFALLIPNTTIVPIVYTQRETYNLYVTQTFYDFSPRFRAAFPTGAFNEWPLGTANVNPNTVAVKNAYSPSTYTYEITGALAYTGLHLFNTAAGFFTPYVLIYHNGANRFPNREQTLLAYENTNMNDINVLKGIDHNATGAYPFSSVAYLFVVQDTPLSRIYCSKDRFTFLYLLWTMTSKDARKDAEAAGIYFLPDHIHNEVTDMLLNVGCYDDPDNLLDLQVIDDHDGIYFEILLAVSMTVGAVVISACLFMALTSAKSNSVRHKTSIVVRLYNIILITGGFVAFASIGFFYATPDRDWACQTRLWLAAEGCALFLGAMFTRTLQIHRVRDISSKNEIAPRVSKAKMLRQGLLDFVIGVGISVFVQTTILIVWAAVDPLVSELSVIDEVARTASWVCKCDDAWIWLGLEIALFFCLLVYGMYVVLTTWSLKDKFPEAKWLLMSIQNVMLAMAALIPIAATIKIKDKQVFILADVGITFFVSTCLLLLFVDRIGLFMQPFIYWVRGSEANSKTQSDSSSGTTVTRTVTSNSAGAEATRSNSSA